MKPKTLILMILAVVCGLVASYMTSQLIAQNKETVTVLKAKNKVMQWTTVKNPADMFEPEVKAKKEAHASAYLVNPADPERWKEELKNRRFRANMEAGDHLTQEHLLKPDFSGIDTMLDKGKRAMSVPISADKAVGFFVVPGSKVDVVQTVGGVSNILLENVLVLAIDLMTSRPEDRAGLVGGTATLQLENNDQVLKLAAAREKGTIQLVMRPSGDDSKSATDDPKQALLPVAPPPPPIADDFKEEPKPGPSEGTRTPDRKQAVVKYMDIMNGSQFFRVEATRNEDGKTWTYAVKNYDEVMNVVREREEKRRTPPPAPTPMPEDGSKPETK